MIYIYILHKYNLKKIRYHFLSVIRFLHFLLILSDRAGTIFSHPSLKPYKGSSITRIEYKLHVDTYITREYRVCN